MQFQLKKIFLWPRNNNYKPREIVFSEGQLNIITGASKTGKSAIVPIIDYCLGSERCSIPVKTIRDACSWFGIVVSTEYGEKLFARREPGEQQTTGDMFVLEGQSISVPREILKNNDNVKSVKLQLDKLAGLSNLGFDPSQESGFKGRPSFRDLLAFTFQPQNIIANPDVLFFKADTMEHKEKLRTIFPYVLGAVTPQMLEAQWGLNTLNRELYRKENELNAQKRASEYWNTETANWVYEARDLGLVPTGIKIQEESTQKLLNILEELVNKSADNIFLDESAVESSSSELSELVNEERQVSIVLADLKARDANMNRLKSSLDDYSNALVKQRERLSLSTWLRDLSEANDLNCPICGNGMSDSFNELHDLCQNLSRIEEEANHYKSIPIVLNKEHLDVKEKLRLFTNKFNGIRTRRIAIERRSERLQQERWKRSSVDRFIGRMEQALKVLNTPNGNPDLVSDVSKIKDQIAELRRYLSSSNPKKIVESALKRISGFISKLLPYLDNERPDDPVELLIDELTLRVNSSSGRSDYLWEIGSGANWLSYHVVTLLALHTFFLDNKKSPIPNFLVFDQPSQVYFPRKLAHETLEEMDRLNLDDEDMLAVRKVFELLSKATVTHKGKLQFIILDHAGEEVWGGLKNVALIEEWRDGEALVPLEWLQ